MMLRKMLCLLLALMLICLCGCAGSAKSEAMDNVAADMYYEAPAEKAPELGKTESDTTAILPTDRKLIRTIHMEAETEDLTTLMDGLTARIGELGGYVEAKNLHNGSAYSGYRRRNLSMVIRIPAEKADAFVAQVGESTNVVSSTETVDDVTLQYVDTESQVKALETEQARLIELLAQAETLEDILKIEDRLTDVRYELERYASHLRTLENQVSYATIHLNITEVKEYTPVIREEPTMWQRIRTGFVRSLKDIGEGIEEFFIWILVNSPYLLIWGLVLVAVVVILRKGRGKKKRKIILPKSEDTHEQK